MKKKFLSFLLIMCLIVSCSVVLSACGPEDDENGQADPTLYKLTFTSNLELTPEQMAEIEAVYGYGEEVSTFPQVPAQRDPDEVDELISAGATQADIDKAGVKQQDGSYYFFDQDPIYIKAPQIAGYKLVGFYDGNKLAYNPAKQQHWETGTYYLPRWNMENKDVELEARYEKLTYRYYFNSMEAGDTNPNSEGRYCYIDEGQKTILPATTSNPNKTFLGWEYQDTANANGAIAEWIPLEKSGDNYILPIDFFEDDMRLGAIWEMKKAQLTFEFVHQIDSETTEPLTFDEAMDSISLYGNLTKVDGQLIDSSSQDSRTPITANSVIMYESGSWLYIFPTANDQYDIWKINIGERDFFYDSTLGYVSIYKELNISEDTTIKVILTNKNPG